MFGPSLIGSALDDVDGCDSIAAIFPPGEYWGVLEGTGLYLAGPPSNVLGI